MAEVSQSGLQYNYGPGMGQYTLGASQQGGFNPNQAFQSGGLSTGRTYAGPLTQGQNAATFRATGSDALSQAHAAQGQVLGASTTQAGNQPPQNRQPIGNLDAIGNFNGQQKTYRSAMSEGLIDQYGNALQPTPQQNMPDYQSIIQPALDALQGAIGPAQSAFGAANAGIDASVLQSKNDVGAQEQAAVDSANTQQQGLSSQEQNQEALQRQSASDTVRGIQAQFGGSNSAGSYLGEQAYRGGLQNIQQLQTGLQNATAQINNQISNVHNVTMKAFQDIDAQAQAQKANAQNQLDQSLQQIRMAQGQLQSQKAQMTAQALQNYQSVLNSVNAQNAQFKQNLYVEQQRAQQLLALYGQRVSSAQTSLKSVTLGTDLSGKKTVGSFDSQTGQYRDQNGNLISNPGTGTTTSEGGGTTGIELNLPKQAANNLLSQPLPQQVAQPQQNAVGIGTLTSDQQQRVNGLFGQ